MKTLRMTVSRYNTDPVPDGMRAVVFTDRVIRKDGVVVLGYPMRVFASRGVLDAVLVPNAQCDDRDFYYVVTVFNADGSLNAHARLVLPDTGGDTHYLYDLVPVAYDLDTGLEKPLPPEESADQGSSTGL